LARVKLRWPGESLAIESRAEPTKTGIGSRDSEEFAKSQLKILGSENLEI